MPAPHFTLNGFSTSDYTLYHGIAAPNNGQAIFPSPAASEAGWGGEAIFDADAKTIANAKNIPLVQVLDCYPLSDLARNSPIDLLHINIQGAEADFVAGNLSHMASYLKRVLIGTHSRAVEGRLETLMLEAGWRMEMDRPVIAPLSDGRPHVHIEGVQIWANPTLCQCAFDGV